jgi:hypothetical protein
MYGQKNIKNPNTESYRKISFRKPRHGQNEYSGVFGQ